MNKILKNLTAVLALSLTCVSVGCGGGEAGIDKTKTQLYISNYDGGYGSQWLYDIAAKFEGDYAETVFQDEKKGVQIHFDCSKNNTGATAFSSMASSRNDVYFTESCYYYDFVSTNKFLDITDVVTGVNADGKTVESKLTEEQKKYYKTTDGKYFGLPHYLGYTGIMYDIDLFEARKLYMKEGGGYVTSPADKKSKGPDNVAGTADDGLPATYEEFYALCDRMTKIGITPFVWSGEYSFYTDWLLTALLCDYEGLEQMMLNYNFNGTAENLITVKDGVVTKLGDTQITNETGWKLYGQAGRYYALDFLKNIIDKGYVAETSFSPNTSNISAQDDFLMSKEENKPIAFLAEGIWWANEASETFKYMEAKIDVAYGIKNRNLGYLPLPKATADKVGEGITIYDTNYACAFINGNIDESKIEVAKEFLKYCYTDQALEDFTLSTGAPKALTYEISEEGQKKLTPYAKNIWKTYRTADVVYPYSNNNLYLSSQSSLVTYNTWETTNLNIAVDALRRGTSAETFFNGITAKYSENMWNMAYSKYFN